MLRLFRVQIIKCAIKTFLHAINDTRSCLADELTKKMLIFEQRRAVGHLLRLCHQRAVDLFVEEVGVNGPNPRQFSVLINVFQNPGMSQTTLVKASGIDRSTLTEVLKRMIDRRMIAKRRNVEDQRTNALFLTDEGRATLRAAFENAERVQERILRPAAEAERDDAIATLTALSGYQNPTDGTKDQIKVSPNPGPSLLDRA